MKETQQNKKATHVNMDGLIKSISANKINSGQIECESIHLPKRSKCFSLLLW